MNVTQVPIPEYDGRTGNYMKGRQGAAPDKMIYHHIVGDVSAADLVFRNPNSVKSAHFAIGDGDVHQYVSLNDTSFGAGNWQANIHGINKEHADLPGGGFSDLTYETSAQNNVQVARFFGRKVGDFQHLPHSAIVPTACPGGLDIDRIVRRAMEIEASGEAPQTVLASAVTVPVKEAAHCAVDKLNIRSAPSTSASVTGSFAQGQGFWYVGKAQGNGHLWLVLENGVGYVASEYTDYNPNQSA